MSIKSVAYDIHIAGTPDECYAMACDFETYPQWQSSLWAVRILLRDTARRPLRVEFDQKAAEVGVLRYTLEYAYEEERHLLTWDLVNGDFLKAMLGSYRFEDIGSSMTRAFLVQNVEFTAQAPTDLQEDFLVTTMKRSLLDLKQRVESGGGQRDET